MSYELQFLPSALKEWHKLGATLQIQFKKKLRERLARPHVPADALHGMPAHYKIKLRSAGYRVNGGVKMGQGAAQNWATFGLRGTRVMGGGQSAALTVELAGDWPPWTARSKFGLWIRCGRRSCARGFARGDSFRRSSRRC
ncbi:type II toxin-antitoxin system RelE family toxin [Roseicyclus marinus]|uniref:Uncharacterized protein n=1 Tax=Roseicyclus marinus TaxID=2161673 RepID=A0AA48HBH6_9RHOB|nr:hypothetical protein MACH21_26100 [Roseicyclus marinus]